MESFNSVPKPIVSDESERKEAEFTSEDRAELLKKDLERLADLHKLAAENQQKRIRGEISGVRCDEEDSHIQKTIKEVEDDIKSLRENA
ncbi:MAG: hypothetical protein WAW92_02815 [Minisyncoccia bacterium]